MEGACPGYLWEVEAVHCVDGRLRCGTVEHGNRPGSPTDPTYFLALGPCLPSTVLPMKLLGVRWWSSELGLSRQEGNMPGILS